MDICKICNGHGRKYLNQHDDFGRSCPNCGGSGEYKISLTDNYEKDILMKGCISCRNRHQQLTSEPCVTCIYSGN